MTTPALGRVDRVQRRSPWLAQKALEAGYASYDDYLQSEHWQQLRAQVLERDEQCCHCGRDRHLTVHHRSYSRLGHERLTDLTTLCARCHRSLHKRYRQYQTMRKAIGDGRRKRR